MNNNDASRRAGSNIGGVSSNRIEDDTTPRETLKKPFTSY
jgi:hypothetical protein